MKKSSNTGRECRCRRCGSLLAMQHGVKVHVKYKEMNVIGFAPLTVDCRKCKTANDVGNPGIAA